MVVVDTNVVAYLLIEGDQTRNAQALFERDPEWKSEGFLLVEFSNILATYIRTGGLSIAQGSRLLNAAETTMRGLVDLPHQVGLEFASRFGVSAYDARFLATAERLGSPLVTEDSRLRACAPGLTQSLAQALGSR